MCGPLLPWERPSSDDGQFSLDFGSIAREYCAIAEGSVGSELLETQRHGLVLVCYALAVV